MKRGDVGERKSGMRKSRRSRGGGGVKEADEREGRGGARDNSNE